MGALAIGFLASAPGAFAEAPGGAGTTEELVNLDELEPEAKPSARVARPPPEPERRAYLVVLPALTLGALAWNTRWRRMGKK